jgi:hypothetical protein
MPDAYRFSTDARASARAFVFDIVRPLLSGLFMAERAAPAAA